MKLKNHHCTEFYLRLRTRHGNFASEEFFKDSRVSGYATAWKTGEPINITSFTRTGRSDDYHVHAALRLAKEKVELRIRWVTGVFAGPKNTKPPFADNFLPWIAQFFKKNVGPITVIASYSFPTSKYRSSLSLPLPFTMAGPRAKPKTLLGVTFSANVTGASRATIETEIMPDGSIWAMIYASYKGRLPGLGPQRLLPEFDAVIGEHVVGR